MQTRFRFFFLMCLSAVDFAASTVLFVNGNKWKSFHSSLANYSFAHTFVDLWFWMVLRTSAFLGCIVGVAVNLSEGPERVKENTLLSYILACANAYFACAKLLVFSEQPEFVAGPELAWFWCQFGWTFMGIGIFLLQWRTLGSTKLENIFVKPKTVLVDAERQPLLSDAVNSNGYAVISDQRTNKKGDTVSCWDDAHKAKEKSKSASQSTDKQQKEERPKAKSMSDLMKKPTLKKLFSYVLPDWPLMVVGFIFLVGASVSEIFLPLFTGKVITGIVVSGDHSNFGQSLMEMAGISLMASLCAGLRGGCFMISIQRLNIRVRNALFASISRQEIGFFDETRTGDITSRLTSDTTTMCSAIGLNLNIFLRSMIKAIGVCVFMFALSWRLAIVTFAGLPLVIIVSKVYGSYYKKLQKLVQDRFAYANEVAEEVCSSMPTVRSFANEEGERARYRSRLDDVYKVQRKQAFCYSGYTWFNEISGLLLVVGVLWYAGHLIISHQMTGKNIISFVLYQFNMANVLNSLGSVYTGLMQALGAAEKVFQLIDRKPKIDVSAGTEVPASFEGHIKFDNVSFAYPTRENQSVLQNVSFEVKPGEVVALVGPSGGGKSSCVKLLQRFYDPTSGDVLIDGRPVSSYKHEYLHEKVSMVGQEPVLFARSVTENIAYGLDKARCTNDDVEQAAVNANAHSFISQLPEGYETETGEKGTQLSGGQKQRIAIARALIRNPRILLLDEATSALDTVSEFLVQEALERSKSHRTVLLIAHRLSTVERADRIVVIVNGQVAEQGSHNELMEKKGVYYKLVYRQLHSAGDASAADDDEQSGGEYDDDDPCDCYPELPGSMDIPMFRARSPSGGDQMSSSCGSSVSVTSTIRSNL